MKLKLQKQKTYDYTNRVNGQDYVFEPGESLNISYMTGHGKGIKPGDFIILELDSNISHYQVEHIDYYLDPPDMWMASLRKINP